MLQTEPDPNKGKEKEASSYSNLATPGTDEMTTNWMSTWSIHTYIDAEKSGHPVQVVGINGHAKDFGHNGVLGPFCSKLLHQLH